MVMRLSGGLEDPLVGDGQQGFVECLLGPVGSWGGTPFHSVLRPSFLKQLHARARDPRAGSGSGKARLCNPHPDWVVLPHEAAFDLLVFKRGQPAPVPVAAASDMSGSSDASSSDEEVHRPMRLWAVK